MGESQENTPSRALLDAIMPSAIREGHVMLQRGTINERKFYLLRLLHLAHSVMFGINVNGPSGRKVISLQKVDSY